MIKWIHTMFEALSSTFSFLFFHPYKENHRLFFSLFLGGLESTTLTLRSLVSPYLKMCLTTFSKGEEITTFPAFFS